MAGADSVGGGPPNFIKRENAILYPPVGGGGGEGGGGRGNLVQTLLFIYYLPWSDITHSCGSYNIILPYQIFLIFRFNLVYSMCLYFKKQWQLIITHS